MGKRGVKQRSTVKENMIVLSDIEQTRITRVSFDGYFKCEAIVCTLADKQGNPPSSLMCEDQAVVIANLFPNGNVDNGDRNVFLCGYHVAAFVTTKLSPPF